MTDEKQVLDVNGRTLQEGDEVLLLSAPDELLSGLPYEDQSAIKSQIGKVMSVQDFDSQGNVELEFRSGEDMIHFIWIGSSYLRKIS
jgi:hypothetical protein